MMWNIAGRFGRLEYRIVSFFVFLLLAVQVAGFFSIFYAIEQSARSNLREELNVGERVFKRLLEQNSQQLVEATAVLAYDFAFRDAVASQDGGTILSALSNHSARIRASGMALVNLQNVVVADTMQAANMGRQFAFPELIAGAADKRRASAIRLVNGTVYQIVVVPVMAPLPISWVAMYFVIDDAVAADLKRITGLDVTFMGKTAYGPPNILATTLDNNLREALRPAVEAIAAQPESRATRTLGGEDYETLSTTIERYDQIRILALLQRSNRDGMQPFDGLKVVLLVLVLVSLVISVIVSIRIARRISRPVTALAAVANRISSGEYVSVGEMAPTAMTLKDEIGDLAKAFDGMSRGLEERDKMRDVLGKVASPAVAERLLRDQIELGGEVREVTVLFADIRNFTTLCERLTPHQSLTLLNRYLECINSVVDEFGGVIDKYMGDGAMALFGAPIAQPDDPRRAVMAALEINRRVAQLGKRLAAEGMPNPEVGIGVNTSRAIAGNVGTPSRLNYTVLGDGVNLAARLEGLTKRYRVAIVVGEETMRRVPDIAYRELDKVRVKGKSVAVRIFEPLGPADSIAAADRASLDRWQAALEAFRQRDWNTARAAFESLRSTPAYQRPAELHLGYIRDFDKQSPDETWDGTFTLYEK